MQKCILRKWRSFCFLYHIYMQTFMPDRGGNFHLTIKQIYAIKFDEYLANSNHFSLYIYSLPVSQKATKFFLMMQPHILAWSNPNVYIPDFQSINCELSLKLAIFSTSMYFFIYFLATFFFFRELFFLHYSEQKTWFLFHFIHSLMHFHPVLCVIRKL